MQAGLISLNGVGDILGVTAGNGSAGFCSNGDLYAAGTTGTESNLTAARGVYSSCGFGQVYSPNARRATDVGGKFGNGTYGAGAGAAAGDYTASLGYNNNGQEVDQESAGYLGVGFGAASGSYQTETDVVSWNVWEQAAAAAKAVGSILAWL